MKKIIVCLVLIAALVLGVVEGISLTKVPDRPLDSDSQTESIMNDLATITIKPHPAGSPENQAVRDFIIERANQLGLDYEVLPFRFDVKEYIDSELQNYKNAPPQKRLEYDSYISEAGYSSMEELMQSFEEMVNESMGGINVDYLNLDNILVKVKGSKPQGAAMFMAHYDSVITAPGASDNGLAVACLMHSLKLATRVWILQ